MNFLTKRILISYVASKLIITVIEFGVNRIKTPVEKSLRKQKAYIGQKLTFTLDLLQVERVWHPTSRQMKKEVDDIPRDVILRTRGFTVLPRWHPTPLKHTDTMLWHSVSGSLRALSYFYSPGVPKLSPPSFSIPIVYF